MTLCLENFECFMEFYFFLTFIFLTIVFVLHYFPHWTSSETGAYGFGLDFRVHASATISRTCIDRFYLYLAQRQHTLCGQKYADTPSN